MAASAAAAGVRPLLARPWVHLANPTDVKHVPFWTSLQQQHYCDQLFKKGLMVYPVLVAETLSKMNTSSPHIAFAGRSNVGKSTLLNMLLHSHPDPHNTQHPSWGQKKLLDMPLSAPVSQAPGRTRHLFRFELGGQLTFVDLPGYGFAKAPRATRESWETMVDEYLSQATRLSRVISLVDATTGPKESDEQLWEMLQERKQTLMVVLTKVDQVSPQNLNRQMAHVISQLQLLDNAYVWPYVHAVSGLHGHGVGELRTSISAIASDAAGGVFKKKRAKGASR